MSRLLPLVLAGCAALLLVLIGVELVPAAPTPLVRRLTRAAHPAAARVAAPDESARWAETVLARPLFSPQRRPPAPAAAAAQAATTLPRLSGILVGPGGARAIFAPDGGGKPIVLSPGARLDGGVIRAIGVGGVVLARAGGEQVLRPRFDAATAAVPASPPNFLQPLLRAAPQGLVDPAAAPSDPNDLPGITPFARPGLSQFQLPSGRPP